MKNFKKVLSLALAALMVIGGLVIAPVDAKADEVTYTQVTTVDGVVDGDYVIIAKWEDTYYALTNKPEGKSYHGVMPVTISADGKTITPVTATDVIQTWTIDLVDEATNTITIAKKEGETTKYLANSGGTGMAEVDAIDDNAAQGYNFDLMLFKVDVTEPEPTPTPAPTPNPNPDSGNNGGNSTTPGTGNEGGNTGSGNTTTNPNTGDMNTVGLYIVLFAGVALVAVSVLGKKKMA